MTPLIVTAVSVVVTLVVLVLVFAWPGKPEEADAEELQTGQFQVHVTATGETKIMLIKVVREQTGLGLKEAKDLVDSGSFVAARDVSEEVARASAAQLEAAGASVHVEQRV